MCRIYVLHQNTCKVDLKNLTFIIVGDATYMAIVVALLWWKAPHFYLKGQSTHSSMVDKSSWLQYDDQQ